MNTGKIIMGLSLLLMVIFSIMAIQHDHKVEESYRTPEKLYKIEKCMRDTPKLIPTPERNIYVHYGGMIGSDTYAVIRSIGHNSWPVYYRTDESYIEIFDMDSSTGKKGFIKFQVIEVRPKYLLLKLAKE